MTDIAVENVSKRFGGLQALSGVSLPLRTGEVRAVIGPNGAGKSTLINCLTGAVAMDTGRLVIDGRPVGARLGERLVEAGITRTFQNVRLFASLTALDHLLLARRSYERSRRFRPGGGDAWEVCHTLLDRVGLSAKAGRRPAELAYGERRRLEIARGLAIEPVLFLVDEPAAGSTGTEQATLATLISGIAAGGVAVVLVEHHMDMIGRVADAVTVLNFGRVIAEGAFSDVKRDPAVVAAYLGTQAA